MRHNLSQTRWERKHIHLVIGIVILVLLFLFANRGFRKLMSNRRELKRLEQEMQQLVEEKNLLIKERELARNDTSYLERTARRELGLIQPGEIEYRFIKKEKEKKTQ